MNEKHVTDLELSKQLFKEGITKDYESLFWWKQDEGEPYLVLANSRYANSKGELIAPALLLSELLELMPRNMPKVSREIVGHGEIGWEATCEGFDEVGFSWHSPLEALSNLASSLLREGKFNKNAK